VPKDKLFPRAVCGYSFDTVTIDVPVYLNYLVSRFLEKGGSITRGHIQHINQILQGGSHPFREDVEVRRNEAVSSPDAVIVCVGLGARFLGGVEDHLVYPSRGQTVILRAPWVRFGKSFEGELDEWIYIIPRKSGDVIIGGTKGVDDWCARRISIVFVQLSKAFLQVYGTTARNHERSLEAWARTLSRARTSPVKDGKFARGGGFTSHCCGRSLWIEASAERGI